MHEVVICLLSHIRLMLLTLLHRSVAPTQPKKLRLQLPVPELPDIKATSAGLRPPQPKPRLRLPVKQPQLLTQIHPPQPKPRVPRRPLPSDPPRSSPPRLDPAPLPSQPATGASRVSDLSMLPLYVPGLHCIYNLVSMLTGTDSADAGFLYSSSLREGISRLSVDSFQV